ncbi:MAG: transcriptional regulator [Candidatus Sumerlaeota bacterium]|nr:transcriptional regulator [Candidatus Sumerlaeota bacterium]
MKTDEDKEKTEGEAGRYAYEGLDRVLHEKARLGILTSLASRPEGLLFSELRDLCSLTDGNLSRHLQTLEEAGLVEVWKGFQRRRPQTLCRLSAKGRERFLAYLEELEKVVHDAAAALESERRDEKALRRTIKKGWAPA